VLYSIAWFNRSCRYAQLHGVEHPDFTTYFHHYCLDVVHMDGDAGVGRNLRAAEIFLSRMGDPLVKTRVSGACWDYYEVQAPFHREMDQRLARHYRAKLRDHRVYPSLCRQVGCVVC
jgi:hypothetical protein